MLKSIKKNLASIILSLIFIFGIGLLAYPTVANWWNSNIASHSVANYVEAVSKIDNSEADQLFDEARLYNKDLLNDPGRFHPTNEQHKRYKSLLSVGGSDVIGSIQIPSIKLVLPMYLGTTEEALAMGAGHLEGSSLPVGGLGTHSVITGHRGLPSSKLFTDLDQVVIDDYVILNTLNEVLTYQIDQIRIVLPNELESLEIEPDQDLLTLVTCTPYGVNTHRMLLTGHRVENLSGDYSGAAEARLIDSKFVAIFIAVPILIGLFIYLLIHYRKPKEDEKIEN